MTPTELREALKEGIEALKAITDWKEDQIVEFTGVYSNYYLYLEKDGMISLCADKYGVLMAVNSKRPTAKIVRLFYVDMTEKVCQ